MKNLHLWQGQWVDDAGLDQRAEDLISFWADASQTPLSLETVFASCEKMHRDIENSGTSHQKLLHTLITEHNFSPESAKSLLKEMGAFLSEGSLRWKVERELGRSHDAFTPTRCSATHEAFECWAPLGVLLHVTPSNALSVGPLAVVEGLLTGNFNVLKASSGEGLFPHLFLEELSHKDPSGQLARHIVVLSLSSQRQHTLKLLASQAQGVSVWGGAKAVEALRAMTPPQTRFVEWGPKISFAWFEHGERGNTEAIDRLALDICLGDQQACSSPQCVFLDTSDPMELQTFAAALAQSLGKISPQFPLSPRSRQESAEITTVTAVARLEECMGQGRVWEAEDRSWRVLLAEDGELAASPLWRSIWVKALPKALLIPKLKKWQGYLQSVGLVAAQNSWGALVQRFALSGVNRIVRVGHMTDGYSGEPHDGVQALTRFAQRISVQPKEKADGLLTLLPPHTEPSWLDLKGKAILTKEGFQAQSDVSEFPAELYFKSGGSSGKAKLSRFTYRDYHRQMEVASEGLYAAGLDPKTDRVMNLFFGGQLYGGFISFFTILEKLGAVHFPMAAHSDLREVAQSIVDNRVNVVLGMPSYLCRLFEECQDILKPYKGVGKLFYGGEHFSALQRKWLQDTFQIDIIRSATYGSVDAGPLGFQCPHSQGGVHHLLTRLQHLEILSLESDTPVSGDAPGRLVFTSLARKGQPVERYEIGDMGRYVQHPCPCGRSEPRFELLGRFGDVFRTGGNYLNAGKIEAILRENLSYSREFQIKLSHHGIKEQLSILLLPQDFDHSLAAVREALLAEYPALFESVVTDGLLELDIQWGRLDTFKRTPGSGKLLRILDERQKESV